MGRGIIIIFLFAILQVSVFSQNLLTLEEAIKIGLENNYNIKISTNNTAIEHNNFSKGNAGFLPSINLNTSQSFTEQDVNQEFLNGNIIERDGATSDVFNANASLNWTIFDGSKMFVTYEKLRELQNSSVVELESVVETTIRDIGFAYFKIILESNKLNVLDTSIQLSLERLDFAKSIYEVGKASKLEYMSAQVDYNTDRSAFIRQKELLDNAKIDLNLLMSLDLDEDDYTFPNNIAVDTTLQLLKLEQNATTNNRQILTAQMNLSISTFEIKEITADRFPSIGLNLGYNYTNFNSQSGFLSTNQTNGLTYGFSATWPIFNGFSVHRRFQNARLTLNSNQLRIEQIKLQVNTNIRKAYINYRSNIELLALEQENYSVAKENSEIALERYRLGNSNALELREAQINAVEAAGRLIDASYNTKIAEINLMWQTGSLIKIENNTRTTNPFINR